MKKRGTIPARVRLTLSMLLVAAAIAISSVGANAFQTNGTVRNVQYVVAFEPLFGKSIPYSGKMTLNFNRGIVSGTYTDTSIRPGAPFANRPNTYVSGGVTGDNIHFTVGSNFSFNGKIEGDTISGSVFFRGRIYRYLARQGTAK